MRVDARNKKAGAFVASSVGYRVFLSPRFAAASFLLRALVITCTACTEKRPTDLPAYQYISSSGLGLTLESDERFRFTAPTHSLTGTYARSRETGLLLLTVESLEGDTGALAAGSVFTGIELAGLSLVLQGPAESAWGEPQVFVTQGTCPTSHVEVSSLRKPASNANAFLSGYLQYRPEEAGRLGLIGRYSPGDVLPLPDIPEEALLPDSTCADGVATYTDGTRITFGTQGSLLLDATWGSFFGLPFAPAPALKGIGQELIGYFWDESRRNADGSLKRPSLVGLTLQNGTGRFQKVANAAKGGWSDEPVNDETYLLHFDDTSPNAPQRAYWKGELRLDETRTAETLCLAGTAAGDAYRDFLYCTGASPYDTAAKIWIYTATSMPSGVAPQNKK